ncbi:MAG: hypothetical protein J5830_01910 [Clostridia bacterium]|nr:hypothetical protein [Clostridia bacterium]
MSIGLIIAGLFIISEPCLSFIDVIPDFIGVFLILKGISRLESAFPSAEESASFFRKYAISSLIIAAATIPALSLCSTDPAMNMVFALAAGIANSIFAFRGFSGLFDVVEYINETGNTSHRTGGARFSVSLIIFSKYVLALLPQLVYLDVEPGDGLFEGAYYPLAPYRNALMVVCAIISVLISAVCLVFIIRFFKRIGNDEIISQEINKAIIAAPARRGRVVKRTIFGGLTLLIWAAWIVFPLELDSYPLIPFFASAVFAIVALIMLKSVVDIPNRVFVRFGVFAGMGLAAYIAIFRYLETHHMYSYDAWFFVTAAVYAAYLVLGIISSLSVIKVLDSLVDSHGGEMLDTDSGAVTSYVINGRMACRLMNRITFAVLSAAALIGGVSFFFQRRHPEFRVIHMAVYAVFCIVFGISCGKIRALVSDRYNDA